VTDEWRPQVIIRCGVKGCWAVIDRIEMFPAEGHPAWTDPTYFLRFQSCLKHGGIPETIQDADRERAAKGLPPVDRSRLMHTIYWRELLRPYRESRAKRRAVDFKVMPLGRSL
jgi:hypothetical protein